MEPSFDEIRRAANFGLISAEHAEEIERYISLSVQYEQLAHKLYYEAIEKFNLEKE